MQRSPNFSLEELTASETAVRLAADITCPQFGDPLAVCRAIVKAEIATDQVIHEYGRWCHVAFAAPGTAPKGELFTIASADTGYEPGLKAVVT